MRGLVEQQVHLRLGLGRRRSARFLSSALRLLSSMTAFWVRLLAFARRGTGPATARQASSKRTPTALSVSASHWSVHHSRLARSPAMLARTRLGPGEGPLAGVGLSEVVGLVGLERRASAGSRTGRARPRGSPQAHAGLGQPDGVDVGADQVLVRQVEARRVDLSRTPSGWGGGRSTGRGRCRSSST